MQIHHIIDWAKGGEDTFENLIALCANCHQMVTRGEIDQKAVRQMKSNLGVLQNRYGDFERRVIDRFAKIESLRPTMVLPLPAGRDLDLWYLVEDGLLIKVDQSALFELGVMGAGVVAGGVPAMEGWQLTDSGFEFVQAWVRAESVV